MHRLKLASSHLPPAQAPTIRIALARTREEAAHPNRFWIGALSGSTTGFTAVMLGRLAERRIPQLEKLLEQA